MGIRLEGKMLTYINILASSWHRVLTASLRLATLIHISGVTLFKSDMPAKQKVTLYLSDELHRQFKIRSAVDGETMSSMAERAIEFYLGHAEVVEGVGEIQGQTHRIHTCPKCDASVALRKNSLALIQGHAGQNFEVLTGLERISELGSDSKQPDEGELITC